MKALEFTARRASLLDAEHIAAAHRDSIRSIGPGFYSESVVENWVSNSRLMST